MKLRLKPTTLLMTALVAAVVVAACSPVRVLNVLSESDAVVTSGVAYGGDPRQTLDIYVPTAGVPPFPVAVFFYGGSWNTGRRSDFRFVGEALAARGIVAVIPDYRLYPQVRYPAFLEDSARAAAWTVANIASRGGDPNRVFAMGHSAGAYNAAMLALDPRWMTGSGSSPRAFAGFIGLAGPYDFLPIENPDVKPVFFHPDSPPDSQPMLHAGPSAPPSFIAAPGTDRVVDPDRNARQLAEKLIAARVDVTYVRYTQTSHVTLIGTFGRPLRWLAPVLDDVVAFIKRVPRVAASR